MRVLFDHAALQCKTCYLIKSRCHDTHVFACLLTELSITLPFLHRLLAKGSIDGNKYINEVRRQFPTKHKDGLRRCKTVLKAILVHLLDESRWLKTVVHHLNPSLCFVGYVLIS